MTHSVANKLDIYDKPQGLLCTLSYLTILSLLCLFQILFAYEACNGKLLSQNRTSWKLLLSMITGGRNRFKTTSLSPFFEVSAPLTSETKCYVLKTEPTNPMKYLFDPSFVFFSVFRCFFLIFLFFRPAKKTRSHSLHFSANRVMR